MDHGSPSEEVTFDQISELARELFHHADATGVWSCLDHPTQLFWRKEAVRRLQQERYKTLAENA